MNSLAENAALLYLLNQDTKSLSPAELYQLYADTVKEMEAYAKGKKQGEFYFSFGPD